jgi:hypothetical protein
MSARLGGEYAFMATKVGTPGQDAVVSRAAAGPAGVD